MINHIKASLKKSREKDICLKNGNYALQKKVYFWVLVKISSSILLYVLGELALVVSVAVAVSVSDMLQVTPNTTDY